MCPHDLIVPYSDNSITMKSAIVDVLNGVTLIAGGPVARRDLSTALRLAPVLVAADGGADRALALGAEPVAVIGDMDSLSGAARSRLGAARVFPIPEQESTDFDKALRSIRAAFVLTLGCLGGRVDHELAALRTLAAGGGPPCVLIGRQDVVFAAPPALRLQMRAGDRFSLFPMRAVTGQSSGLRWPIDGIGFAPDGRVGTSNVALGPVDLCFDGPGMLVIVPRARLKVALRGLGVA